MLKVLFISSGNSAQGISPIVKAQGESLKKSGIDIQYFTLKGHGLKGYLKNVKILREYLLKNRFDVIHAHYSWSGIVAGLSGAKPLIVSLMGSDCHVKGFSRLVLYIANFLFWNACIVKSQDMLHFIKVKAAIIPNGVDFDHFVILDKDACRRKLNLPLEKKIVLFLADPNRKVKNYQLAEAAMKLIHDDSIEFLSVHSIQHDTVPDYLNAADVILMTSLWEGSPNVIKESMACNCPIVATNVGDISDLLDGVEGCYVTSFEPSNVAENVEKAIKFNKRTDGRSHIQRFSDQVIAERIKNEYQRILNLTNKSRI